MPKMLKLQAAVIKARGNWRKVCADDATTAAARRNAYSDWKKAEGTLTRALLLWKSLDAERRKTIVERRKLIADRRKANVNADWLNANADRRKTARRP